MARLLCLTVVVVLGCAPAVPQRALPAPADIPRLRETVLRDTTDFGARVGLAVALREAGRLSEAVTILANVVVERPTDPGPLLLLGLTQEENEDWREAALAYGRYVEVSTSARLRSSIERRLPWVERKALEAEVRELLRSETAFGVPVPDAGTVAVFPFLFEATDTTLIPLSRAMAELLVTDLGYTDRLRVLERARVQLLLNEIRLSGSALVDAGTAARSGRLLRAGRVVQGTIGGSDQELRLGAVVVDVGRDTVGALDPLAEQDAMDRLFDMEKRLALSLYASLGVELTVAERERVLQRPTTNILALLAFGRGLEAEDRGDWALALQEYMRARSIDPDFEPAERRVGEASAIADADETTVQILVEIGVDEEDIPIPSQPESGSASTGPAIPAAAGTGLPQSPVLSPDPIGGLVPDPLLRDPGAEVLGQEGIGARTLLRIIFHRPSGAP